MTAFKNRNIKKYLRKINFIHSNFALHNSIELKKEFISNKDQYLFRFWKKQNKKTKMYFYVSLRNMKINLIVALVSFIRKN
jgi:hypothetical protein